MIGEQTTFTLQKRMHKTIALTEINSGKVELESRTLDGS